MTLRIIERTKHSEMGSVGVSKRAALILRKQCGWIKHSEMCLTFWESINDFHRAFLAWLLLFIYVGAGVGSRKSEVACPLRFSTPTT